MTNVVFSGTAHTRFDRSETIKHSVGAALVLQDLTRPGPIPGPSVSTCRLHVFASLQRLGAVRRHLRTSHGQSDLALLLLSVPSSGAKCGYQRYQVQTGRGRWLRRGLSRGGACEWTSAAATARLPDLESYVSESDSEAGRPLPSRGA